MLFQREVSEASQRVEGFCRFVHVRDQLKNPASQWQKGCTSLVLLSLLCAAVPQSASCCDPPTIIDDRSLPIEPNRYSHEVCLLHSSRPEASEFATALQSAGVATSQVSKLGHDWLIVSERNWRKAQAIAKDLDFSMLPAEGPIADLPAYPDAIRPWFFEGNWSEIHKHLIATQDATTPAENPLVARVMDECQYRRKLEQDNVQLPTSAEWKIISKQLTRTEMVNYLLQRVALSRANCVVNGLLIPSSIQQIESAEIRGKRCVFQDREDDTLIDPLTELYLMKLTFAELQPVMAMLSRDYTFLPAEGVPKKRIRLIPSSRYCYCVLMNSVLGKCNSIREYDLSEEEWQDSGKVSALIHERRGSLPNKVLR